jgi:sulfate adenylyltransferase
MPLATCRCDCCTQLNTQSKARALIYRISALCARRALNAQPPCSTYEVLKDEVANPALRWAYLPYSMHMAGPREAIQHMIIRKNFGATHFIIGRDMAGCKSNLTGEDFYGPYDAQNLARDSCAELGMQIVPSLNITYTEEEGYVTADIAEKNNLTQKKLSGTAFRKMLREGGDIPEWFAFKSVVRVLREEDPSLQA